MCDMRRSRGLTRVSDPPVGGAPTRSSPTRRWGPPSWARVTRVRPRVSLPARSGKRPSGRALGPVTWGWVGACGRCLAGLAGEERTFCRPWSEGCREAVRGWRSGDLGLSPRATRPAVAGRVRGVGGQAVCWLLGSTKCFN